MQSFAYPARLVPDRRDGGFTVRFRDLPEALTSGGDRADALIEAADCIEEAIANRIAERLEIPEAGPARRGDVVVAVPAPTAAKAALYVAMKQLGLTHAALAKRLNLHEREVRRMLDPRHPTKLTRIQSVLDSLGHRLVLVLDSAA